MRHKQMKGRILEVVGANGFEPSTSWSRTRESENLKPCGCRTYKPHRPKILLQLVHRVHSAKWVSSKDYRGRIPTFKMTRAFCRVLAARFQPWAAALLLSRWTLPPSTPDCGRGKWCGNDQNCAR